MRHYFFIAGGLADKFQPRVFDFPAGVAQQGGIVFTQLVFFGQFIDLHRHFPAEFMHGGGLLLIEFKLLLLFRQNRHNFDNLVVQVFS